MKTLLDLIYPQHLTCLSCREPLYEQGDYDLCPTCKGDLSELLPALRHEGHVVGYSLFRHKEMAKALLYKLKYSEEVYLAEQLGRIMAAFVREKELPVEVITYVPLHPIKLAYRGYNQAHLLAKAMGKALDLPVVDLIKRKRFTRPLSRLSPQDRSKTIKGAFQSCQKKLYEKVLLVDDIYTTGTTVQECGKILLEAGNHQVIFITFSGG